MNYDGCLLLVLENYDLIKNYYFWDANNSRLCFFPHTLDNQLCDLCLYITSCPTKLKFDH